ncbi:biotin synthase BioB [Clostridium bovifaecis]|uniref:Biotin synthase n=1 Tax=Clostridium bovifaecis TaxID=2184719 RepID=A0A6I6FFM5_9CLOT|nr:biotin synthase BioB [Clostridium bovifaecis]
MNTISYLESKVLNGGAITFEESIELSKVDDINSLLEASLKIKLKFKPSSACLCTVVNAKSGSCSENCKYCAQSVYYSTGIEEFELLSTEEILKKAKYNESKGATSFSMVVSGKGLNYNELEQLIDTVRTLKQETKLELCASLGIMSYDKLVQLKEVGLSSYHHNLQTSRNYFNQIINTHSYDDRINTIKAAQEAGLKICSGGIIGLGETMMDRLDLAFQVKDLGINCIPINCLIPIKGTPLENVQPISKEDILKTVALFRFINPNSNILWAAGRDYLKGYEILGFKAGFSAIITGNMLTTGGHQITEDLAMLNKLSSIV